MGIDTRKKVQRKFKIRGYSLKLEALEEVFSYVGHFQDLDDDSIEDQAINLLLDQLEHESLKSFILDRESLYRVVSLLLEAEVVVDETSS